MKFLRLLTTAIGIFACGSFLFGQERPFPQNVNYTAGYRSSNITYADAWSEYQSWINAYYVECSASEARIDYNGNTVSEGIGYGLVIAAYAGDKEKFDKLLNYYNNRKNGNGVMNWEYPGCSTGASGGGAATDGDLDAAMGMLVAVHQWPGQGYETDFESLATAMKNSEFTNCGLIVQKPGDAWGGCDCTNPSYYAPGYYRAYATYYEEKGDNNNANFWFQAADDAYTVLFANQNNSSGLVSAWTNSSGAAGPCGGQVGGGGGPDTYQYDACRTPWRIATDYLWWGNQDAYNFLEPIVNFVNTSIGGLENVVDGYYLDGTPSGQWHNVPFVGSFALSGMATTQADADQYMNYFAGMQGDNYFNTCLSVMYKFLATGNFWNPYGTPPNPCSQVNLGSDKTLCGSGSAELDAQVPMNNQVTFTWYRNDNQIETGSNNTYTATEEGTYRVVMDSAGACSSEAIVFVSGSLPVVDLGSDIQLATTATLDAGVEGNGLTYTWYRNNNVINGATQSTLTINDIGTYRVEVSATGCDSQSDELIAERMPYISQTTQTITIDGDADEAYVRFREVGNELSGAIGAPDITAIWSGLWDNTNLYIIVSVTDDDLSNDSGDTWYEDDGIEIYIDGDNSKDRNYDNSNDIQYGFVWNTTDIQEGGNNPGGSVNGVDFITTNTAEGYNLEVKIPWSSIGVTPVIGNEIGIDIAINDDDGGDGRENKISWNCTVDDAWQNPSLFGTVVLTEEDSPNPDPEQQAFDLLQGWNLISFRVLPNDSSIEGVFANTLSSISTIKTDEKMYRTNTQPHLNSLHNIEIGKGYLVYCNNAVNLDIEGIPVQSLDIELKQGWNLIGYPYSSIENISDIINSISSNVEVVETLNDSYINGNGTLQTMNAGRGYYIKVNQDVTLRF